MRVNEAISTISKGSLLYFCGAIVFLALGAVGNSKFLNSDYFQLQYAEFSNEIGYSSDDFVWLVLGTACLPIGLMLLLIFVAQVNKSCWNSVAILVVNNCLLIPSLWITVYSYQQARSILDCGIFCFGVSALSSPSELNIVAGSNFVHSIYFIVSLIFSILMAFITVIQLMELVPKTRLINVTSLDVASIESSTLRNPLVPASDDVASTQSPLQYRISSSFLRNARKQNSLLLILVFVVFYPVIIFACMALPDWWSKFTVQKIQDNFNSVPATENGFYWSLSLHGYDGILKLYPDILFYYGSIYLVSVLGLLAGSGYCPSLRTLLCKRISSHQPAVMNPNQAKLVMDVVGLKSVSVGELLLLGLFLSLLITQFCYWYLNHGWQGGAINSRTPEERAARSLGQVANLVTGLLLLPVSRNSIWAVVFGISWEHMIRYHEYLGGVLMFVILLHMALWWKVYDQQGSFPHDIFAVPQKFHQDNFTIPLAVLTAFSMFLVMGAMSNYLIRRYYYEIFYWLHHFSMIIFVTMLWHSTMSWYYIIGGVVLWTVDHVLRLWRSVGVRVTLRDAAVLTSQLELPEGKDQGDSAAKITMLSYTVTQPYDIVHDFWKCYGAKYFTSNKSSATTQSSPIYQTISCGPGQFVFINIPQVSTLEWHPFTLSSAPGDSTMTHHIKSMGNHQWTGRLHQLVSDAVVTMQAGKESSLTSATDGDDQVRKALAFSNIVMNIDGPYGIALEYTRYSHILLVAGGIGVTPLHSLIKHLYCCIRGGDPSTSHIKRVRLLWVSRSMREMTIFNDTWANMAAVNDGDCYGLWTSEDFYDGIFSVVKHCTGFPDVSVAQQSCVPTHYERPDIVSEISTIRAAALAATQPNCRAVAYVCGPSALVDACNQATIDLGVDFKKEVFEF